MQLDTTGKKSSFYIIAIALVASVGGFLFGYDVVIISGALLYLEQSFQMTPALKGFMVSSAVLGAVTGPLIGLWFAEKIGRRKTMMLAAAFFMATSIGCALPHTVEAFCFWRFMGGIGIGLAMMTSPIYIAELAPVHLRGMLVNINQLSNVIGINLAVVVGYLFSFEGNWRWMFGSEAFPVLFLIIGLFLIPESPRWLVEKGRFQEALKILTRVNGKEKAGEELEEIKVKIAEEKDTSVKEMSQPAMKTALFVGIILMIFSQVNGVNMMLLYAPTILSEAGIHIGSNAILSSIPIYVFIFICTLLAFPLIKKYSRRGLLITSVLLMALGHIIMAFTLQLGLPPLYILIPMLIGTGAFTLGFAPLSWIITAEIFPNRVRGKAMAIVCFFLYLSSFLIAQLFPMLTSWFTQRFDSPGGLYWGFAGVCLLCAVFSWKMVPETKNVSLEHISELWDGYNKRKK